MLVLSYLMKSEMGRARMRVFIGVTAQWKASILARLHVIQHTYNSAIALGCMHLMEKRKEKKE